jgi:transitional endoplasmic reticulum ATPase
MSAESPSPDDALQALREALRASPNNLALRQHFAETLLGHGQAEEAEKEFREALGLAPNSLSLKLGLARAFYQQGKHSHALVIVEDLTKNPNAPARARLLHARLLAGIGEIEKAVSEYRRAVEIRE